MPKISLIVPCYNSESFISDTIESVIAQEFTDWELILVDDGSTDNTWSIISGYASPNGRIKAFQKVNGGTADSRNYGFSKANPASNYLFFLDHDDKLERNALALLNEYMDQHADVGLVATKFYDIDPSGAKLDVDRDSKWSSGGRWAPGFIFPKRLQDHEFETPFETFFCAVGQGPFAMYRRSVYEKTTGWETKFWPHEDTDMFCQMALLSKVHFLPNKVYLKRVHPDQGMSDGERIQRAYRQFREKWDNLPGNNAKEKIMLKKAKKYYYSVHRPCRNLPVAKAAFNEFISDPSIKRFKWFAHLINGAFTGLVFGPFKNY